MFLGFILLLLVTLSEGEVVQVVPQSNVTLNCNKIPSWLFNGGTLDTSDVRKYIVGKKNLTLLGAKFNDLGIYQCGDDNNLRLKFIGDSPMIQLNVQSYAFINDKVTFSCSSQKTSPLTKSITWLKNNINIRTRDNVLIKTTTGATGLITSTLQISKIMLENNGTYKCDGDNGVDLVTHSKGFQVYDPPEKLFLSLIKSHPRSVELRFNRKKRLEIVSSHHKVNITVKHTTGSVTSIMTPAEVGISATYKVEDLMPGTLYSFIVHEEIGDRKGSLSNELKVSTNETAPTIPQNLIANIIKDTSITVEWHEPTHTNGVIRSIQIKYYFYDDKLAKDQYETKEFSFKGIRMYELTNLYPFVYYTIFVREKTNVYSPPAKTSAKTQSGASKFAPRNLDFRHLNVLAKNSSSVIVTWDPIPKYRLGADSGSYVLKATVVSNTSDSQSQYPETDSYVLTSLKCFTAYYIDVTFVTIQGSGEWSRIHMTTSEGIPTSPRSINAKTNFKANPGLYYLAVSWDPPREIRGDLKLYQIVYRMVSACNKQRCPRQMSLNVDYYENVTSYQGTGIMYYLPRSINAYSVFSVKVRASTHVGWGPYSRSIEVYSKSGVPSKPRNVSYTRVAYSTVGIRWSEPLLPNGIIVSYKIYTFLGNRFVREDTFKADTLKKVYEATIEHLEPSTTYNIKIRAYNSEIDGEESEILFVTTTARPTAFPWLFVLIGCLATVLLIALLITIPLLVSRHRKKYKEVQTKEEINMDGISQSKIVFIADLREYLLQQHANSDHGFQQEYEMLLRVPAHNFTWEHSLMPNNQSKNRYSNILAYDHSRVILSTVGNDVSTTYINANYIDGFRKPKKYIATQGPLPETVLDFWRMIWEYNCPIIVMLTKLIEDSRVKCEQYWPSGKGLQYKDIIVTVNSVSEMTDYTVRVFTLQKVNNPELGRREVIQYHYTAWPDHGVPSHPTSMLSFTRHVMSHMNDISLNGPIVVHCSAGVGRTGTFIAIEGNLQQIESDKQVDVFGTVCRMRMQRKFMVQTESQYTFIYDALLDNVVCGNTEISPINLITTIRHLNQVDANTGESHFAAEFKRLESGLCVTDKVQYVDASRPENKHKNRYLNVLPYDKNRVKLSPIAGTRQSDYINASIIDGFQQKHAFIASQAPLEHTVNDFWRMILEQEIRIIVMLTKLEEKGQEKCYLYWPQAGTVSYGTLHVEVMNVHDDSENVVIHDLRLTDGETGRSWLITHFMYTGWPEYGSPENGNDIIQVIGQVQKAQRSCGNSGPVLVHCSGGVGRTGVFISIFNSIERLKSKNVVDIFQTIRALRLQRTAMVQTVDQYIFCYHALTSYLDSFEHYANPSC